MNISPIEEFEVIQNQMNEFSQRLDTSLARKRAQIINDKQLHYVKVNELKHQESQLQSDIERLKLKEGKVKDTIKKNMEDLQLQQLKIQDLRKKQESLEKSRDEISDEINDLNDKIGTKMDKLATSQKSIGEEVHRDEIELVKFERYLGLKIHVLEQDSLRFVFSNIDPKDFEKEVSCDLFVGGSLFKIGSTSPTLEEEKINEIENNLNRHKDFVLFLKELRSALISIA